MSEKRRTLVYIFVIIIVVAAVGILIFATDKFEKQNSESPATSDFKTTESNTTENKEDKTTEKITDTTAVGSEDNTTEKATEKETTKKPENDKNTEDSTTSNQETSDIANLPLEEFAKFLIKDYNKKVENLDGKKVVCIDPGHQGKGNNNKEPIGPGATETKKRVSYGTAGVSTRIAEYKFNLELSLMLKEELIKRGYEVVMVRETNDINISNAQRAILGNNSGADIAVRIHANGSDDSSVHGALTIYPTKNNEYIPDKAISEKSKLLSEKIINSLCEETGAKNRGALGRDNYTGSNWSKIPVTIVENGYMSNASEDELLAKDTYRAKLVKGIADGIDEYFENIDEY